MNLTKISFYMVIYNEEKLIRRCLESIKDIADEIIVIHDGPCSDQSISIAKEYNCVTFETENNLGIGEKHYIKALNLCKNDWVFKIDADEFLHPKDKNKIFELTSSKEYSGYYFVWPLHWDGEHYRGGKSLRKLCLFRKSEIGYVDIFHHPLILKGKGKEVDLVLEHRPQKYAGSKEYKEKVLRWEKRQALDMSKDFNSFEIYNLNHSELDNLKRNFDFKKKMYNFPFLVFIFSFLISLSVINIRRNLLYQIYEDYLTAIYSYNVAKFYKEINAKN
jgi:glycosyltransferase involved in cell wall biosynthesis